MAPKLRPGTTRDCCFWKVTCSLGSRLEHSQSKVRQRENKRNNDTNREAENNTQVYPPDIGTGAPGSIVRMCEKSVVLCTSTGAESVNVEESAFLLFSLRAKIIVSVKKKKKRQARQTRRFTEQVAWLLEVEVWAHVDHDATKRYILCNTFFLKKKKGNKRWI